MAVKSAGRYYRSGNQSIPSGVATKVQVDVKDFDLLDDWDAVNKRFVAPEDGLYHLVGVTYILSLGANKFLACYVYVNGVLVVVGRNSYVPIADSIIDCAVGNIPLNAGDYVEVYCYHSHGSARDVQGANCILNWAWLGEIN